MISGRGGRRAVMAESCWGVSAEESRRKSSSWYWVRYRVCAWTWGSRGVWSYGFDCSDGSLLSCGSVDVHCAGLGCFSWVSVVFGDGFGQERLQWNGCESRR